MVKGSKPHGKGAKLDDRNSKFPAGKSKPDSPLNEFFDYKFPTFVPSPHHTTSTGTREPAYFDKHLDCNLRLRKVVYLPTLAAQFNDIFDDALKTYLKRHGTLPPVNDAFPTSQYLRKRWKEATRDGIRDESSLQLIYHMTIAHYSSCVAATLEFQLPAWYPAFLTWSTKDPNPTSGKAVADGFLTVKKVLGSKALEEYKAQIPPLCREYEKVSDTIRNIGIWEFKSLKAGKLAVFAAILDIAKLKEFPWVSCEHGPLCVLNCQQHNSTRDAPDTTPRVWIKPGPSATLPIIDPSATDSPPGIDVEVKYSDETHAVHILQQLWAEMLKNDVTFACLNAGIYEMIVMRDRASNVLYLSELLRTDEPGLGKRHTGLFISMLRDAKQRSSQIPTSIPVSNAKIKPCAVKSNKTHVGKDPEAEKQLAIQEKIRRWDWVVMDCPLEPGAYKRTSPYVRASPFEPFCMRRQKFSEFYRIKARPYQNLTLEGTITVRGDISDTKVVVKCAGIEESAKQNLLKEAKIYQMLHGAGVACIPVLIGFFRHANLEGCTETAEWMVMVLENVGSSTVHEHKSRRVMQGSEKKNGPPGFRVAFVGFKGAFRCTDDHQKEKEVLKLWSLLEDPALKRKVSAVFYDPVV
ncbi:hypothetical protein H0H87_003310 [Tephrocybe sp. NHM501043]|nr:hypothetical protein H0H87_003310 [Tephrocybe sp. NHM501043]